MRGRTNRVRPRSLCPKRPDRRRAARAQSERAAGSLDRLGIGVEGEHAIGVGCEAKREATVATAQFEYALPSKVAKPAQRGEMGAFRVDDATHRSFGL